MESIPNTGYTEIYMCIFLNIYVILHINRERKTETERQRHRGEERSNGNYARLLRTKMSSIKKEI